ncbi:MAG: U32 family peptidase [Eubacteriales bacterium]|nr:U32 family peptidase [Eubacteriales bacterium]
MYNHTEIRRPELLSPAGDYERLVMAVTYGADAVYLAGREFGMRAAAANFDNETLIKGIQFAHEKGCRVYVTCNTLPREDELKRLPEYLEFLESAGADALIIADLGVLSLAKKYAPNTAKHVSTQLGVINSASACMLYELGADTVVLARETPLEDIRLIRKHTPKELKLEAFVHGAMCVSFSGRCLLSNYLTNRDSNRGQCAQPCRWKYHLMEETRPGEYFEITEDSGGYTDPDPNAKRGETGTYIFNSNDMCMIEHLGELYEAGIDSFKIEGRMKSAYYTATVTNAYRHAVDAMLKGSKPDPLWIAETEKVSHRPYSTGFYYGYPGQHYGTSSYTQNADIVAVVEECDQDGNAVLTQRNRFFAGDQLELMNPELLPMKFTADKIYDMNGAEIPDTHQAMLRFRLKLPVQVPQYTILRKER